MKLFHPRFVLQLIALLSIFITFGWLFAEPSFETALAFTTAVAGLLTSFFVRDEYITTKRSLLPTFMLSNRIKFLKKVRLLWIKGFLDPSLPKGIFFDLNLISTPDRVLNPAEILPTSFSKVSDAFFAFNEELLLLGKPGAGKTTLLLKIAVELIERGEQDETAPMPVVLTLSSWVNKRATLKEWLLEEIEEKYYVSKSISEPWLENNQFVLFLDGFDEVPKEYRRSCALAVNNFREEYGLIGMVICSRIDEYLATNTPFRLAGAVEVQPLTHLQIEKFLKDSGISLLRNVEVKKYHELLQSPLVLSLLPSISQDQPNPLEGLHLQQSTFDKIFDLYIKKMLIPPKTKGVLYSESEVITWLRQIALIIQKNHDNLFLLDRLQPNWLEDKLAKQYVLISRLIAGIIAGILVMPVILILTLVGEFEFWNGLQLFSSSSFFNFLVLGFMLVLFIGGEVGIINYTAVIIQNNRKKLFLMDVLSKYPSISTGVASALIFFLIGVLQSNVSTFFQLLFFSIILGVFVSFISKRILNIRKGWGILDNDIQPVNEILWSWKSAIKGASIGIVLAVAILVFHPLFVSVTGLVVLFELVGIVVLSFILGVPIIGGVIGSIIFFPITTVYYYLKNRDLKFLKSINFLFLQKLVFLTGYGVVAVRLIYNSFVNLLKNTKLNLFEVFDTKSIHPDVVATTVNWDLTFGLTIGFFIVTCISLASLLVIFIVKFHKSIQLKNSKSWKVIRPFIVAMASLFAALLSFLLPGIVLASVLISFVFGPAFTADFPSTIIVFIVIGGLFSGFSQQTFQVKTVVNQGIKESLRNAAVSMLRYVLAITVLFLFAFSFGGVFTVIIGAGLYFLLNPMLLLNTSGSYQGSFGDIQSILIFSLLASLMLGVIAAMWNGGFTVVQHYSLRYLIAFKKILPWKMEDFLDYAVSRSLLRKIGGGYIFIHPLMQKYFAKRNEHNDLIGVQKRSMTTKNRSKKAAMKNVDKKRDS